MPANLASLRSLLFSPGSDEPKLQRALASDADAVIADLEDAVVPAEKAAARDTVARLLGGAPTPGPARLLRVNGAETPFFDDDVAFARELVLDGVVLPKSTPAAAAALAPVGIPILAIVETALGVRHAYEIAASAGVFALMLGAADLGSELGLEPRADGQEILYFRSRLVLDSAAAGVRAPIDGVHLALRDEEGLEQQARLARSLGLHGKACIHPAQVAIVNRAFSPDAAEIDWAQRIIEAAEAGAADGRGAVELDGAMVDAPVVARARRIIGNSERREEHEQR